jgi:glucose/arabinose dehydrogenase
MPAIAFPGHYAPLAVAFYSGDAFGARYAGGAFIAFHGSWNRAPLPQAGYRVVFVPFVNGRPQGSYETFATSAKGPTGLRAAGLAVAPDGALFISDDRSGQVWRVTPAS